MSRINKISILLLCLIIIVTCITPFSMKDSQTLAAVQTGIVINVNTTLNVRISPGTVNTSVIGSLKNGAVVTVLGSAKASDGSLWYNISYITGTKTITGYVSSSYLKIITAGTNNDTDFEKHLTAQNFPESYKSYLRTVHAQYPNWVFNALHTNLDWVAALNAQSIVGRNLVPSSSIASWKSFERGAYDWTNKKWYGLDGASWVAASREIIAYYLDPRNSLDTTSIFQFESLSYSPSYHTEAGVKAILSNTFMKGNYTTPDTKTAYSYAGTFMQAAKISNVSPYHLASRARQEQGVNGNLLSSGTVSGYSGYFNFFNIGAYAHSGRTAIQNGAIYASTTNSVYSLPWTNQYKSITGSAVFLGSSYINKLQDTLYLQKFDAVDGGNGYYTHQYMTNVIAPTSEASNLKRAYSESADILTSAIVFNIPVYLNMPASAAEKPTSTGDNNNFLSTLSVAGHTVTPNFSMYTQNYELVVENSVSSITINASASGSSAKVSGTGNISLAVGNNICNITVTAASGVARTYKITVNRKSPENSEDTEPAPSISSSKYNISSYITGLSENLSAAEFKTGFTVVNGTVKITDASGKETGGVIGTGCKVQLYSSSGELHSSYTVILYGDANGDGKITTAQDIVIIQRHILQINKLAGAYLESADVSGDGKVNTAIDIVNIQKHILKLSLISQ